MDEPGGRCDRCGHPDDPHELVGEADPELGFPIEGWRRCPESQCPCYATWSMDPFLVERFRDLRRE